mgnify:FL=1
MSNIEQHAYMPSRYPVFCLASIRRFLTKCNFYKINQCEIAQSCSEIQKLLEWKMVSPKVAQKLPSTIYSGLSPSPNPLFASSQAPLVLTQTPFSFHKGNIPAYSLSGIHKMFLNIFKSRIPQPIRNRQLLCLQLS